MFVNVGVPGCTFVFVYVCVFFCVCVRVCVCVIQVLPSGENLRTELLQSYVKCRLTVELCV